MNVLISPNAFKGTISAKVASELISKHLSTHFPTVRSKMLPIADGGDGTCVLLAEVLKLELINVLSLDPYGRPISGSYGWDSKSQKAYLDLATASGIVHLNDVPKAPHIASTYGTGILIKDAIQHGAVEIILGLGGSASIDLGVGILASLGIIFLDKNGREIPMFSPNFLSRIKHIQISPAKPKIKFTFLSDVKNMFFGKQGAISVFGGQKGLKTSEFDDYEKLCLEVVEKLYTKGKTAFVDRSGFGAAGGVAMGLKPFFETTIKLGASYFFDQLNLLQDILWADWIITGEGRYDAQSSEGKGPYELLKLAHRENKKVMLISSGQEGLNAGFDHFIQLPKLDFNQNDVSGVAIRELEEVLKQQMNPENWVWD